MADPDYTDEVWKTIAQAPSYEVSNAGRVRRVGGGQGARPMIRKQDLERQGYLRVRLSERGVRIRVLVHRLVLLAFVGEPPTTTHQAAHWDGDKTNNRLGNLRWATCRENILDKQRHGTQARGETQGRSKLTDEKVRAIRRSVATATTLALEFGVCPETIRRVQKREGWRHV